MVSKIVPRKTVFSWSINFETDVQEGDWFIYYYDPNGVDMYKIQLDATTKTLAKGLMNQIQAWMNTTDTWVGAVVEHWQKKQAIHPEQSIEEWVQI